MSSIGAVIRNQWKLITFVICLLLFGLLVWKLISVVLPFIIGLIIAYLLLPIVRWLERHLPGGKKHPGARRISIIIGVYFVGLIIMAALAYYMFTVVSSSVSILLEKVPQLIPDIVAWVQDWLAQIRIQVPVSMLQQYDQAITSAGVWLVNALRNGLSQGFSMIVASASLILGFLALPLIVFFMLKDWDRLRDGFLGIMPSWASEHAKNVAGILQRVLGRYIRGQVIMSTIIGILVYIMLSVLKIEFAPALALWAALMENIPTLGVWLSIGAGVAIALGTGNEPMIVVWLLLGYGIIQFIENNVLVPRVQGAVMKMNPIFIILVSVIGAYLAGLVGFIIAVPITATVIALLEYFRRSARRKGFE